MDLEDEEPELAQLPQWLSSSQHVETPPHPQQPVPIDENHGALDRNLSFAGEWSTQAWSTRPPSSGGKLTPGPVLEQDFKRGNGVRGSLIEAASEVGVDAKDAPPNVFSFGSVRPHQQPVTRVSAQSNIQGCGDDMASGGHLGQEQPHRSTPGHKPTSMHGQYHQQQHQAPPYIVPTSRALFAAEAEAGEGGASRVMVAAAAHASSTTTNAAGTPTAAPPRGPHANFMHYGLTFAPTSTPQQYHLPDFSSPTSGNDKAPTREEDGESRFSPSIQFLDPGIDAFVPAFGVERHHRDTDSGGGGNTDTARHPPLPPPTTEYPSQQDGHNQPPPSRHYLQQQQQQQQQYWLSDVSHHPQPPREGGNTRHAYDERRPQPPPSFAGGNCESRGPLQHSQGHLQEQRPQSYHRPHPPQSDYHQQRRQPSQHLGQHQGIRGEVPPPSSSNESTSQPPFLPPSTTTDLGQVASLAFDIARQHFEQQKQEQQQRGLETATTGVVGTPEEEQRRQQQQLVDTLLHQFQQQQQPQQQRHHQPPSHHHQPPPPLPPPPLPPPSAPPAHPPQYRHHRRQERQQQEEEVHYANVGWNNGGGRGDGSQFKQQSGGPQYTAYHNHEQQQQQQQQHQHQYSVDMLNSGCGGGGCQGGRGGGFISESQRQHQYQHHPQQQHPQQHQQNRVGPLQRGQQPLQPHPHTSQPANSQPNSRPTSQPNSRTNSPRANNRSSAASGYTSGCASGAEASHTDNHPAAAEPEATFAGAYSQPQKRPGTQQHQQQQQQQHRQASVPPPPSPERQQQGKQQRQQPKKQGKQQQQQLQENRPTVRGAPLVQSNGGKVATHDACSGGSSNTNGGGVGSGIEVAQGNKPQAPSSSVSSATSSASVPSAASASASEALSRQARGLVESPTTRLAFKDFYRHFWELEKQQEKQQDSPHLDSSSATTTGNSEEAVAAQSSSSSSFDSPPPSALSGNTSQVSKDSSSAARRYAEQCLSEDLLPRKVHWRVHLELAELCKRGNQWAEARAHFRNACRAQPYAAQPWLDWAKMEEEQGLHGSCGKILKKGLAHCGFSHEALLTRAIKHEEREAASAEHKLSTRSLVTNHNRAMLTLSPSSVVDDQDHGQDTAVVVAATVEMDNLVEGGGGGGQDVFDDFEEEEEEGREEGEVEEGRGEEALAAAFWVASLSPEDESRLQELVEDALAHAAAAAASSLPSSLVSPLSSMPPSGTEASASIIGSHVGSQEPPEYVVDASGGSGGGTSSNSSSSSLDSSRSSVESERTATTRAGEGGGGGRGVGAAAASIAREFAGRLTSAEALGVARHVCRSSAVSHTSALRMMRTLSVSSSSSSHLHSPMSSSLPSSVSSSLEKDVSGNAAWEGVGSVTGGGGVRHRSGRRAFSDLIAEGIDDDGDEEGGRGPLPARERYPSGEEGPSSLPGGCFHGSDCGYNFQEKGEGGCGGSKESRGNVSSSCSGERSGGGGGGQGQGAGSHGDGGGLGEGCVDSSSSGGGVDDGLAGARALLGRLKDTSIDKVWRTVLEGALLEARCGNTLTSRRVLKYLMKHVQWYGPIYHEALRLEERCDRPAAALRVVENGLKMIPRYGPLWFGHLRVAERLDVEEWARDMRRFCKRKQQRQDQQDTDDDDDNDDQDDNIDDDGGGGNRHFHHSSHHDDPHSRPPLEPPLPRVRKALGGALAAISKELGWKVHFEAAAILERSVAATRHTLAVWRRQLGGVQSIVQELAASSRGRDAATAAAVAATRLNAPTRGFDTATISAGEQLNDDNDDGLWEARLALSRAVLACPLNLRWKVWLAGGRLELGGPDNLLQEEEEEEEGGGGGGGSGAAAPSLLASEQAKEVALRRARSLFAEAYAAVPDKSKAHVLLECARLEEYADPWHQHSHARLILRRACLEARSEWKLFLEAVMLEVRACQWAAAASSATAALTVHSGTGRLWAALVQLRQRPACFWNDEDDEGNNSLLAVEEAGAESSFATAATPLLLTASPGQHLPSPRYGRRPRRPRALPLSFLAPFAVLPKGLRGRASSVEYPSLGDDDGGDDDGGDDNGGGGNGDGDAKRERRLEEEGSSSSSSQPLSSFEALRLGADGSSFGFRAWDFTWAQQATLKQALQEVPKSGEVWCEGARSFLNPLGRTFDLLQAQRCLDFAAQFTPQYGDTFVEHVRLSLLAAHWMPVAQRLLNGRRQAMDSFAKAHVAGCAAADAAAAAGAAAEDVQVGNSTAADATTGACLESMASLVLACEAAGMFDAAVLLVPLDELERHLKTPGGSSSRGGGGLTASGLLATTPALQRLGLRCTNADPNYGALWFQCREKPHDTARAVLRRAHKAMAKELEHLAPLYLAALCRRLLVEHALGAMAHAAQRFQRQQRRPRQREHDATATAGATAGAEVPDNVGSAAAASAAVAEAFSQEVALQGEGGDAVRRLRRIDTGQLFAGGRVWEDCCECALRRAPPVNPVELLRQQQERGQSPPQERPIFRYVPRAEDFTTGLVGLNRLCSDVPSLPDEQRRKILFGCDQIVP